MRVVHDLERQHRERILVGRIPDDFFLGLEVDAIDRAAIHRRGQIIDDGVEQGLHALVLERRAAQHRMEGAILHRLAHQSAQSRRVRLLAVEIGGHGIVIELDAGLDQTRAVIHGLILEIGGDVLLAELSTERLAGPDDRLHLDEVDDAAE